MALSGASDMDETEKQQMVTAVKLPINSSLNNWHENNILGYTLNYSVDIMFTHKTILQFNWSTFAAAIKRKV